MVGNFLRIVVVTLMVLGSASAPAGAQRPTPGQWIWSADAEPGADRPAETRYFRTVIEIPNDVEVGKLLIACDNEYELFLNNKQVGRDTMWERGRSYKVAHKLHKGKNVIAVQAANREGPAGLYVTLVVRTVAGKQLLYSSDKTWTAASEPANGWKTLAFNDSGRFKPVRVMGAYGVAPWGERVKWTGESSLSRFKVPDGFRVERIAGHALTESLWAMTFDGQGRIVVSRQQGPIFTLTDTDGDGECDHATQFDTRVHSCEGLCFIKGQLYAVGDGPDGVAVYRLTDTNGDDRADELETLGRFSNRGMGEHSPHGVVFGPDGWTYMTIGNHAQPTSVIDPDSPLNRFAEDQLLPRYGDPRGHANGVLAPGGTVVRFDADGEHWTRVAGGFRNAYDIAFNRDGELFTYDSDMEWDEHLPWYRPTRVNHVIPSGEYGWRFGSGKWPPYYVDGLTTTLDIGRGSPCGLVFYEHDQFPEKYRGAFFMSDWSMGRIIAVFPERRGATYSGTWEAFATGRPLNVNDVEVGPDGALYFSIGGRSTEGGVYRIVWDGGGKARDADAAAVGGVDAAIAQKQPEAAWARVRVRAVRKKLGAQWGPELLRVARDKTRTGLDRSRALTLLQQFGPPADVTTLVALSRDGDVHVRSTAVFLLGLHPTDATREALTARLADSDAMVCRRACEAFVRTGLKAPADRVVALLGHEDRWLRYAARWLLQRTDPATWRATVLKADDPNTAINGMLALMLRDPKEAVSSDVAAKQLEILRRNPADDVLLDAIRLAQVTCIQARGQGDPPKAMDALRPILLSAFDRKDYRIKREAGRLLAHLQEPAIIGKMLDGIEKDPSREQQIHYAYCLRAIKTGWTKPQRDRIVDWYGVTQDWTGGASFSGYLDTLWDATLALLPAEERDEILSELDAPTDGDDPVSKAIAQAKAAKNKHNPEKVKRFVLQDPAGKHGDVARGRDVFTKAGCAACHKFGEVAAGRGLGPDLTTVASRFKRSEILDSILEPNKVISDQYKAINVLTTDGAVIAGLPIKNDKKEIVLKRTNGTEITIPRTDVARTSKANSMMPEGILNVLDFPQIADLFAFLESTPANGNGQKPAGAK